MKPKGETADRGLWAEADTDSRRTKREVCGPFACGALLGYLAEHPEADTPILRAYIRRQQGGQGGGCGRG